MNKPDVSVIMPVYNAQNHIKFAIESILSQTYKNFELIIVDDCPTDNTMTIVSSYTDDRIKIIHNKHNQGIAFSRNAALDISGGDFVAIMDDDDIAMKTRIQLQRDYLTTHTDIDIVGGRARFIDETGKIIRPAGMVYYNPNYIKARHLFKNVYINGTVMFRRKIIEQHSIRYMDNYLGMEDFRFWVDCSKVARMSNIDELLLYYRKHSNSESSRVDRERCEARKHLYAEIQQYSLYRSGFDLEPCHLSILTKALAENDGKCDTLEELELFYHALRELIRQAREIRLDNCEEIEIFCRQLMGLKVRSLEVLWS